MNRPLLALLLVAGCSPEPPPKPVTPMATAKPVDPDALAVYRVAVGPNGLLLTDPRGGAAKPADFGLRQSLLLAILARSFGPAEEARDAACERDFARWSNGLTLWFEAGEFVGWALADGTPAVGVAPGMASGLRNESFATRASAAGSLYENVVTSYFARHKVKPGITGWAQINGWRGETDTAEKIERRVEHDLYYIENWSLTFDLYILARTPFALLKTDSAY